MENDVEECTLCKVKFPTKAALTNHTRSMMHMSRVMTENVVDKRKTEEELRKKRPTKPEDAAKQNNPADSSNKQTQNSYNQNNQGKSHPFKADNANYRSNFADSRNKQPQNSYNKNNKGKPHPFKTDNASHSSNYPDNRNKYAQDRNYGNDRDRDRYSRNEKDRQEERLGRKPHPFRQEPAPKASNNADSRNTYTQNSNQRNNMDNKNSGNEKVKPIKQRGNTPPREKPLPVFVKEVDHDPKRPFFCRICNVDNPNHRAYQNHCRGMIHTQKVMEKEQQEGSFIDPGINEEQTELEKIPGIYKTNQGSLIRLDEFGNQIKFNKKDSDVYRCEVCKCSMTGKKAYDSHLEGQRHRKNVKNRALGVDNRSENYNTIIKVAEDIPGVARGQVVVDQHKGTPLIGLQHVTEFVMKSAVLDPKYVCNMCETKCDINTLISHVTGVKHRLHYLKEHYMNFYTIIRQTSVRKSELASVLEGYAEDIEAEEGRQKMRVSYLDNETLLDKNAEALIRIAEEPGKTRQKPKPGSVIFTSSGELRTVTDEDYATWDSRPVPQEKSIVYGKDGVLRKVGGDLGSKGSRPLTGSHTDAAPDRGMGKDGSDSAIKRPRPLMELTVSPLVDDEATAAKVRRIIETGRPNVVDEVIDGKNRLPDRARLRDEMMKKQNRYSASAAAGGPDQLIDDYPPPRGRAPYIDDPYGARGRDLYDDPYPSPYARTFGSRRGVGRYGGGLDSLDMRERLARMDPVERERFLRTDPMEQHLEGLEEEELARLEYLARERITLARERLAQSRGRGPAAIGGEPPLDRDMMGRGDPLERDMMAGSHPLDRDQMPGSQPIDRDRLLEMGRSLDRHGDQIAGGVGVKPLLGEPDRRDMYNMPGMGDMGGYNAPPAAANQPQSIFNMPPPESNPMDPKSLIADIQREQLRVKGQTVSDSGNSWGGSGQIQQNQSFGGAVSADGGRGLGSSSVDRFRNYDEQPPQQRGSFNQQQQRKDRFPALPPPVADEFVAPAPPQQQSLSRFDASNSSSSDNVGDLNQMIGGLSECLVSSEDEASMALQVSNALTQALIQFRVKNAAKCFKS